jgi:hypothetical protein
MYLWIEFACSFLKVFFVCFWTINKLFMCKFHLNFCRSTGMDFATLHDTFTDTIHPECSLQPPFVDCFVRKLCFLNVVSTISLDFIDSAHFSQSFSTLDTSDRIFWSCFEWQVWRRTLNYSFSLKNNIEIGWYKIKEMTSLQSWKLMGWVMAWSKGCPNHQPSFRTEATIVPKPITKTHCPWCCIVIRMSWRSIHPWLM